ncbi:stAR-related lipid transfer protein 5 [Aplysia californica]|uniref:StAR-related lipid transfer protein 5 n=1 Tax=Aplysia californica TaxID=6500 RepID=A0ABM1VTF6_APLCA|nr:stAR-related lipid transfer protein 5 [Aplysia californica]
MSESPCARYDLTVVWSSTNSVARGLISPRDLSILIKVSKEENTVIIASQSVEREDCPPRDKYVRAQSYPWGAKMERVNGDPNKTRVTRVFHIDLKGKLPRSLVDATVPHILTKSYEELTDYLKKNGLFVE